MFVKKARLFTWIPVLLLSAWLICYAVTGILQTTGRLTSHNIRFLLTGPFNNPGPYGGFIAALMAVCISFCVLENGAGRFPTIVKWVAGVAATAGFMILPATMSRAAWLGLAVSMTVLILKNGVAVKWLRSHRWILPILIIAFVTMSFAVFLMKKDSALGRLHMWRIESRIIAKQPVKGVGEGNFAYSYGMEQAAFFMEKERSMTSVRVAGCPEYAFNEYLGAGVEYGLGGLILSIILAAGCCIKLLRANNPLGYGCIVFSVFAFFSYPMSIWQFKLIAGLFLAASVSSCLKTGQWVPFAVFLVTIVCSAILSKRAHREETFRECYYEGYALFQDKAYAAAIPLLERGSRMSSDPMFHNILGRCHEALGEYDKAEKEYTLAHYMVPGRLYPLVLLQEMYIAQEDTLRAKAAYDAMARIPLNPDNPNMDKLRKRADSNLAALQPDTASFVNAANIH